MILKFWACLSLGIQVLQLLLNQHMIWEAAAAAAAAATAVAFQEVVEGVESATG